MAIIKSAWEIAMERAESIEADPAKIKKDLNIKEGRQIAAGFLLDIDGTKEEAEQKYNSYSGEAKSYVKEGMALTLLSNLALPRNLSYADIFPKLKELGAIISNNNEELGELLGQMQGFFGQYIETQEDLVQRLKEQFAPHLQQKEAQLRAQYGPNFTLRPEQDPEFMKILDEQLKNLDGQYSNVLNNAKDRMKEILGIE
ncbi:MAG: DUF6657 family protein [Sphaerochaeta sp.]